MRKPENDNDWFQIERNTNITKSYLKHNQFLIDNKINRIQIADVQKDGPKFQNFKTINQVV